MSQMTRLGRPNMRVRRAVAILCALVAAVAAPGARAAAPGEGMPIIGVNDGSGWGPADSARLQELGFSSERIELGKGPRLPGSYALGWRNDVVIVGNVADEERLGEVNVPAWTREALAQVEEAAAYGMTLMEVGNEMYAKGPKCAGCGWRVEPARYAEMFMSLAHAVAAAHIEGVKLLFDGYGNFVEAEGAPPSPLWSGGGWIAAALAAEPELRTAVGGFTVHPYGNAGENRENDGGTLAVVAQHEQEVSLGFQNTDAYVTEVGVQVEGAPEPSSLSAQARELGAILAELVSFGFVKGIWIYQTHDDPTGKWGLIEDQESGASPFIGRPSLQVVSELALRARSEASGGEDGLVDYGSGPQERLALGSSGIEYHPRLQLARPPWSDGLYD
jgi:hypothetical protein